MHYPSEAHLSTLSHSILRMSKDDLINVLKDRERVILKVRQSSCLDDRVDAGKESNG
jgi:hypothetical protein